MTRRQKGPTSQDTIASVQTGAGEQDRFGALSMDEASQVNDASTGCAFLWFVNPTNVAR